MIIKTDEEIKQLSDEFEKDAVDFAQKLDDDSLLASDYNSINSTLCSLLVGALIGTNYFEKIPQLSTDILESSNLLRSLCTKKNKDDVISFISDLLQS